MTECVIMVRLPNDKVTALWDYDADEIAVFPNLDAALEKTAEHPLCQRCLWQIVELDEL